MPSLDLAYGLNAFAQALQGGVNEYDRQRQFVERLAQQRAIQRYRQEELAGKKQAEFDRQTALDLQSSRNELQRVAQASQARQREAAAIKDLAQADAIRKGKAAGGPLSDSQRLASVRARLHDIVAIGVKQDLSPALKSEYEDLRKKEAGLIGVTYRKDASGEAPAPVEGDHWWSRLGEAISPAVGPAAKRAAYLTMPWLGKPPEDDGRNPPPSNDTLMDRYGAP